MEKQVKVPDYSSRLFWGFVLGYTGVWLFLHPSAVLWDQGRDYLIMGLFCLVAVFLVVASFRRIGAGIGSRLSLMVDVCQAVACLAFLVAVLIRLL